MVQVVDVDSVLVWSWRTLWYCSYYGNVKICKSVIGIYLIENLRGVSTWSKTCEM